MTSHRAIKFFGSLWIYSFLLLLGLGLLSVVWQPPALDTIMAALLVVCALSGAIALVLSFPQSGLPGTRCPRCGEIRQTGPQQFVGEVQGVCACR